MASLPPSGFWAGRQDTKQSGPQAVLVRSQLPDGTGVIPPAALPRPSATGSGPATPAHLLSRIGIVRCSRRAARRTDLRRLRRDPPTGGGRRDRRGRSIVI